jgi:transposase
MCQGVLNCLFLKENETQKKMYDMSVTLGDKPPSYSTVKNWVARFKTGHLSTVDDERSERPSQVTVPENMDAIHSMILDKNNLTINKDKIVTMVFGTGEQIRHI